MDTFEFEEVSVDELTWITQGMVNKTPSKSSNNGHHHQQHHSQSLKRTISSASSPSSTSTSEHRIPLSPSPSSLSNQINPSHSTSSEHTSFEPNTTSYTILPGPSSATRSCQRTRSTPISASSNIRNRPASKTNKRPRFNPGEGFLLDRPNATATANKNPLRSSQLVQTRSTDKCTTKSTPGDPIQLDLTAENSQSEPSTTPHDRSASCSVQIDATPKSSTRLRPLQVQPSLPLPLLSDTPKAAVSRPLFEEISFDLDELHYSPTPSPNSTPRAGSTTHITLLPTFLSTTSSSPSTSSDLVRARDRSSRVAAEIASLDPTLSSSSYLAHSALFRFEVSRNGPVEYEQLDDQGKQLARRSGTQRSARIDPAASLEHFEWDHPLRPSWESDRISTEALKKKLNTKEHFVANVYAKDVVDLKTIRPFVLEGIDIFLLGREFPLTKCVVVGTVVGEKYKDDRMIYFIDDGTAVIACCCPFREAPIPIRLPADLDRRSNSTPSTPKKNKTKLTASSLEQLSSESTDASFEIGTLVKVLGSIVKAGFWEPKSLNVIKMEEVRDPNALPEHLLLVHHLHESIYSNAFDLTCRLEEIKFLELSQARTPSEAASSPCTTPKKVRLPSKNVKEQDLTLANLKFHILFFLQDRFVRHVPVVPEESDHELLNKPKRKQGYRALAKDDDEPSPKQVALDFGLQDLQADSTLMRFAKDLVQKEHRDSVRKHQIKSQPVLNGSKTRSWIKRSHPDEPILLAPPGASGGSKLLLGGRGGARGEEQVASSSSSTTPHKVAGIQVEPLTGEPLKKAVDKVFKKALRELWHGGSIVIMPDHRDQKEDEEDEEEEDLWAAFEKKRQKRTMQEDERRQRLPDEPSYPGNKARTATTTQTTRIVDKSPWGLADIGSSSPEQESRKKTRRSNAPGKSKAPWELAPDEAFDSTHRRDSDRSKPSTLNRRRSSQFSQKSPNDRYQLVTFTSLMRPLYRIVSNQYRAKIESYAISNHQARQSVSIVEEEMREGLMRHAIWAKVGEKNRLVMRAVEELIKLEKIEWVEEGREDAKQGGSVRVPKWLNKGFAKGRRKR